jgi:hypothetical protein
LLHPIRIFNFFPISHVLFQVAISFSFLPLFPPPPPVILSILSLGSKKQSNLGSITSPNYSHSLMNK